MPRAHPYLEITRAKIRKDRAVKCSGRGRRSRNDERREFLRDGKRSLHGYAVSTDCRGIQNNRDREFFPCKGMSFITATLARVGRRGKIGFFCSRGRRVIGDNLRPSGNALSAWKNDWLADRCSKRLGRYTEETRSWARSRLRSDLG